MDYKKQNMILREAQTQNVIPDTPLRWKESIWFWLILFRLDLNQNDVEGLRQCLPKTKSNTAEFQVSRLIIMGVLVENSSLTGRGMEFVFWGIIS